SDEECILTIESNLDEWEKVFTYNFQDNDVLDVCARGTFRHFYILYYICNTVVPAAITINCDTCKGSEFSALPTSSLSSLSKVSGVCRNPACNSSQATISFTCSHNQSHQPTTYLSQITANIDKLTCVACCSNENDVIISFCPSKGHILCLDCFRSYAENYLDTRNFQLIPQIGYTLGCPVGCPDVYISDTHHFRILGTQFYSRYKEIAAHQICYTDAFCNCPRCGSFHWVFCEGPLGSPAMEAESDDVIWKGVNLGPLEIASRCLISSTCRRCPVCKSITNKDGGCNHIHCTFCGSEWCWICLKAWSANCQSAHWF
ncbi:unnamed protein product, partial [Schistocephalus solidus]|uniref:RBR-type E3 ubiquitin transferase n=1 Tax=Schistocephalus solidus TaxID=70667 RepID=A0A183S7P7_SCHSO